MRPWKAATAAVACVVAVVASLYAPGYLTGLLLGLTDLHVAWNTWWLYAQVLDEPAYLPYALRIRAAGVIGISVPTLACVGILLLLFRSRANSLYGEARFAQPRDLARQGMFKPSGTSLIVGKMGRKLVYMSGQQFAILAAPTRSGKGVGIVIPNLLSYPGSVVVLDI